MSEGGDKTEEPSQKKLDDARKEGNVWKSKDLSGVVAFAVAMSVVSATWSDFEGQIKQLFHFAIDHIAHPLDLVTEVDRACEVAIVARLRRSFPSHDVVAEESAPSLTGSEYVWYVDPLDGTTKYAHNYPFFCTSIALARRGSVIASAVYDPVKNELFTAARGRGATCNGHPLRVSASNDLQRSVFLTGFPYDLRDDVAHTLRLFERFVHHASALRRDGAAALDLAYLAAGRIDGYFEERLKPWDVLAGALLVEEAGGRMSRFDGSPIGITSRRA